MQKKASFTNVLMILLLAILIVGSGMFAYLKFGDNSRQGAAQQEQTVQKAEMQECRDRLAQFYKAWSAYRADHKSADPPSIEALIPKYLPNPELLVCPTAARWIKKGKPMQQGTMTMNRRQYPVTYGFQWLSSGYAHLLKKSGDRMPLVICEAHKEGLYRAAYRKPPGQASFDPEERMKLVPAVQEAYTLVLRHNGTVDFLDPNKNN